MKLRDYTYRDFDGLHYPDTFTGSVEVYKADFSDFLADGETLFRHARWEVDDCLDRYQEYMDPDQEGVACIKLGTPYAGVFKLKCLVTLLQQDGQEVTEGFPFVIRVY